MASNSVSVWLLRLDRSSADRRAALVRFGALLDDAERRRALSYVDEHASIQYIFGRALLQMMLRHHLPANAYPIDAGRCQLSIAAAGKPALAAPFDRSGMQFNLSHSGLSVICAMASRRQLGVDIEARAREVDFDEIAARHFATGESAAIRSAAGQSKQERFFYYWTLKEAYLKAKGTGIAGGLHDVSFVPQRDGTILLRDTGDVGADDAWGFSVFDLFPDCQAALCWQRRSSCFSPGIELRIMDGRELGVIAGQSRPELAC
ncbi:4'-phosphopantetheinyl transferase family protein [Collimonas pratensis]|uniref:4'-phosphopantetheinyl transferase superfamily protein n=1 Tax=Collimonas pratensis TaxID=279113 RepID=A0A127QC01_9BURK|nr:4'-phosphopantetheinyl transferase superfamily protein [Collimonas pratensis]AMP07567.1 4'-phosphopantetheinyl transferase superfamily protein [Collimonas pratensis]